jgi:hypothetical protein
MIDVRNPSVITLVVAGVAAVLWYVDIRLRSDGAHREQTPDAVRRGLRLAAATFSAILVLLITLAIINSNPGPTETPHPDGPPPTAAATITVLDCSSPTASPHAVEVGPWTSNPVRINPDTDGWVQADFSSTRISDATGYDEVSVIVEPWVEVMVSNVGGTGWKYDRNCTRPSIEQSLARHVDESWRLRHKRLLVMSLEELCRIVECS